MSTLPNRKNLAVFSLLVFLLLTGWGTSTASDSKFTSLVRVDIQTETELVRLAKTGIPILGKFTGDQGEMFLLIQTSPKILEQLLLLEFPVQKLDDTSSEAVYFEVNLPDFATSTQFSNEISVLKNTGLHIIVRATQQDAEELLRTGANIKRLFEHPLIISETNNSSLSITAITPDPNIQSMVDLVEADDAYDHIGGLSGEWQVVIDGAPFTFYTRYSRAELPMKRVTDFTYDHFEALGLNMDFDYYTSLGPELRNVIAEQPGITNPSCIILLVGHLDSYSIVDPYNYAPGADDNASGATGVMMAASILHKYQFECTIRYILFTGEEQGYYGSWAYVKEVYSRGENIVALVNLDMIGYDSNAYPVIELHTRSGNTGDLTIANIFKDVVTAYNLDLTTQIVQDGLSWSDHYPFWSYGYFAILAMEDKDGDFTPYYHRPTDRLSTLNMDYLTEFIKGAVGTVAHLAGFIPPIEFYFPVIHK